MGIKYSLSICVWILICINTYAQEVRVINNKGTITSINNNRVFTQATDPNPTLPIPPIAVEGDIWFDTSTTPNTVRVWNGIIWLNISASFAGWLVDGNSGTNSATNFLGTIDAQDLVLKAGNVEKIRLNNSVGQVLVNQAAVFNSHPLVIRANGIDVLAFQDNTGAPKWHWNLLTNGLNFVESNIADFRLFLENGGNVGVNTNNPTEKLDINGKLRIRDIATATTNNDILTATTNGVVEKRAASKFENTWLGKDDNLAADVSDTEIYKDGKIGVGNFSTSTIDANLHVKSSGANVPFKIEPSATTPIGTSGGQIHVDNLNGILYIFDGTRNKWLSVSRFMIGWGRNDAAATNEYLRQFNGALSNNNGWRMIRNGTITAITAQSNINQSWTLEIRKNDNTTPIATLVINAAQGNHNNTLNVNVNEGDFIQAFCNGTSIDFPQALIEIAWRK